MIEGGKTSFDCEYLLSSSLRKVRAFDGHRDRCHFLYPRQQLQRRVLSQPRCLSVSTSDGRGYCTFAYVKQRSAPSAEGCTARWFASGRTCVIATDAAESLMTVSSGYCTPPPIRVTCCVLSRQSRSSKAGSVLECAASTFAHVGELVALGRREGGSILFGMETCLVSEPMCVQVLTSSRARLASSCAGNKIST